MRGGNSSGGRQQTWPLCSPRSPQAALSGPTPKLYLKAIRSYAKCHQPNRPIWQPGTGKTTPCPASHGYTPNSSVQRGDCQRSCHDSSQPTQSPPTLGCSSYATFMEWRKAARMQGQGEHD
ncbi:putative deoxyribonuclease tatdn3-A [Platysternon megacephalum]|uniref:Putative deoxyribonuclease tatdn3-A n=1 Tax=Platysternon megacephalum TaxID=55544 RepID=A0A4D9DYR6_9SAUR|nr:putative deoxyribonuclease tatdn3-A [Platysternon megacephalum]